MVVLIGDEGHAHVERPPLSKDYLQGTQERDGVFVHPMTWFAEHDIDVRVGCGARMIEIASDSLADPEIPLAEL